MTEDDRIKEYLNQQIAKLEDDEFTKIIIDSHFNKLQKSRSRILHISSQLVYLTAVTLFMSVSCLFIYITDIKTIHIINTVVDPAQLYILMFVVFIAMAYRYLFHLALTKHSSASQ
jgi:hypothetical protein